MSRYVAVAVITVVVGGVVMLAAALASIAAASEERAALLTCLRHKEIPPPLERTVVWTRQGHVQCAYRGTVTPLDDDYIVIEGGEGPVVVRTPHILKVVV